MFFEVRDIEHDKREVFEHTVIDFIVLFDLHPF
jgi:hypothetical protein